MPNYAGHETICRESTDLRELANEGWEWFKQSSTPRISDFGGLKERIGYSIESEPESHVIGGTSVARLGWHLVAQMEIVRVWAADRRLWNTHATTEFNLEVFARAILSVIPD